MNPISRSGMAQPASMPSIQLRNRLRHRAGEISERAANFENARSMGTPTHTRSLSQADKIDRRRTACDGGNPFCNCEAACLELLKNLNVPNLKYWWLN
jgi:hypothetical protein